MDNNDLTISYTTSLSFDKRLYTQDIAGSIAHAKMLGKQGIISKEEADTIVSGLIQISQEIKEGKFAWRDDLEDVHMNIENRLRENIGLVAGKLHTGRSRNDQVATDMRLYVKEITKEIQVAIQELQKSLIDQAELHVATILPGYTHLQKAQPVLLAHHLLAYVAMLDRDVQRFSAVKVASDVSPLGSGALAGSPYPLDREFVATELGFSDISENSLDAVSDRDFVIDFLYSSALAMVHLSRLAEELIIWSSQEFGFVELADSHTTGSSMMPQKRNPDVAELARGRVGRVLGNLVSMLTVMKGLPLSYNRDLQEDKEPLFDTVDTLLPTLRIFSQMIERANFKIDRMFDATQSGYLLATDLADYLVFRGMPFREAHGIIRELTRHCNELGQRFEDLSVDEYRKFSTLFDHDVLNLSIATSISSRNTPGGTAPSEVKKAISRIRQKLSKKNVAN